MDRSPAFKQEAYARTPQEVAGRLGSDPADGLNDREVALRRQRYGPNEVPQAGSKTPWHIFLDQWKDPIILILATAAVLAYLFTDTWEAAAILVVVAFSVGIGFFMERQAYRTLETLRILGQARTRVRRSGKNTEVRAADLVPGDLVVLGPGDLVPADLRLCRAEQLSVKESVLTGESAPVFKRDVILPAGTPLMQRKNMLYKGTVVLTGSGCGLVVATATDTEFGKIQALAVSAEPPRTPLEKKLRRLSLRLIWLTLFLALAIAGIGYLRGVGLVATIETGMALAIAAIPEGLPIVATIALAQGMLRLARRQVVVKNLEAVQTLGATDVILTDKTGTLTEDALRVHRLLLDTGGDKPEEIAPEALRDELIARPDEFPAILLQAGVLCNNADPADSMGSGDSIEKALLGFAIEHGYSVSEMREARPERWELPFDPGRKYMATVHQKKEGYITFVKGAFETLAEHCPQVMSRQGVRPFAPGNAWSEAVSSLASQGLRTLAFAYRTTPAMPHPDEVLQGLVLLGVVGFLDPPRTDVRPVFDIYRKAGIHVVMVTGDHPDTARRIAEEVGLLPASDPQAPVVSGTDLTGTPYQTDGVRVFARVLPEQKLDLVSHYQQQGHIVGMIGDGINDVPALKKADIGIATGLRGTEAAREASDVILKNDSFGAIECAIRQGRVVFANIRHFVIYLLSCNLAEILVVGVAALANLPAPLLPMQILFLNLVTDVFPALALGLGKGEKGIMEQPPRDPALPVLERADWLRTLAFGLGISAAVLGVVLYAGLVLHLPAQAINNLAFNTLVMAQLLHVFNLPRKSLLRGSNEVTRNPYIWGALMFSAGVTALAYYVPPLARVLELDPVSPGLWHLPLAFSLVFLLVLQAGKELRNRLVG